MISCLVLLGHLHDPKSKKTLLTLAAPKHPGNVRRHALVALARLPREKRLAASEAAVLLDYARELEFSDVGLPALEALGRRRSAEHRLGAKSPSLLESPHREARQFATRALEQFDTDKAAGILLDLLDGDDAETAERGRPQPEPHAQGRQVARGPTGQGSGRAGRVAYGQDTSSLTRRRSRRDQLDAVQRKLVDAAKAEGPRDGRGRLLRPAQRRRRQTHGRHRGRLQETPGRQEAERRGGGPFVPSTGPNRAAGRRRSVRRGRGRPAPVDQARRTRPSDRPTHA